MKTVESAGFARVLHEETPDQSSRDELHKLRRRLWTPLAIIVGLIALWAASAPLSGAVVAPAQLRVELNRKTVQHKEGGIVREILVRDGQKVRAGQPLVVIGDVRSDAELSLLQEQVRAERLRAARAAAETALEATFEVPATRPGEPAGTEYAEREAALFAARRRTLDEQIASLESQVRDARAQASALESQIAATEKSAELSAEELRLHEKLVREGFVQKARLLSLQREESDYRSRIGESRGEAALARQRIGELSTRMAQARNQYQQQAADELKQAAARLRELEERLRPSRDQVERQLVRSPVDGEVMALRVSAIGDVVGPRDPILDVVPLHEKLVVEARIRPQDINHVRRDAPADVRLLSLDARTTPLLPGTVTFVSPDRVVGERGDSWFVATVEVDARDLQAGTRLQAGMPAELFVRTPARTFFEYLVRPLTLFSDRAMREP
jgi:HlyD family type I secretion membrane fusion protein